MSIAENKIGFIKVSKELLKETPDLFEKYLSDIEVLSVVEPLDIYKPDVKIYKCLSDEFEPVKEGQKIPYYNFVFERFAGGKVSRGVQQRK